MRRAPQKTLNLCLDNAIAGAVTEFSRQREEALRDGEAEQLGYLTHELRNLLSTAISHGKVAVRTTVGDGIVSIEVEDECGGLPEGNAEALFAPFGPRRGKDRTGLGLGLDISRKAVKACGGEIRVHNLPGKGCIFSIELPIAASS